jgi:hypothetical protein
MHAESHPQILRSTPPVNSYPLKVKIPVPGTEYSLGLGLTLEASLFSAGVEGGFGAALNDGKKLIRVSGGAKAGAGLFGVGAKFGLELEEN